MGGGINKSRASEQKKQTAKTLPRAKAGEELKFTLYSAKKKIIIIHLKCN